MTIPQMPINTNFNPTPTIYEQQTSGRHDLQNQGNIGKGNVVIVPQSDTADISFVNYTNTTLWNYKSESDRPSLPPAFTARGSGANIQENPASPEENFNALNSQLPEGMKGEMTAYPTPQTVAFNQILKSMAEAMTFQETVKVILSSENAINRQQANLRFPDQTFTNTLTAGNELVTTAERWLSDIGPNDPHYLEAQGLIDTVKNDLSQVKGG
jgi:hypothetical protein